MCDYEEEIEDFLSAEKKLKLLMDFYFKNLSHETKSIKLTPPIKKGFNNEDKVVHVIKKSKRNGKKLF